MCSSKLKTHFIKENGKCLIYCMTEGGYHQYFLIKLKFSYHGNVSMLLMSGQNCSINLSGTRIVLIHFTMILLVLSKITVNVGVYAN